MQKILFFLSYLFIYLEYIFSNGRTSCQIKKSHSYLPFIQVLTEHNDSLLYLLDKFPMHAEVYIHVLFLN